MTDAKDKTGKKYESVTQGIFQLLVDLDSPRRISLQHNVKLKGKTATHQIDVYWKFEMAGVEYETIIETKDWNDPVEQDKLFCFKAVLDDLPGQPKGIFVTRSGYQSGAIEYADAHGISLYKLDMVPPTSVHVNHLGWAQCFIVQVPMCGSPTDGETTPKEFVELGWKWIVYTPRFTNFKLRHDPDWLDEHPLGGKFDIVKFKVPATLFRDIVLFDQTRAVFSNVASILHKEIADMRTEKIYTKQLVHTFDSPTFVGPPLTPDFIKVNAVVANIEIESEVLPMRFGNSKFVEFVLHEVISGKTRSFFRPKE